MSLQEYQRKRRFQQTPEPVGRVHKGQGPLHFVVHKHLASRLHYDLRLEAEGTLKSWAVPKGPSLNPKDKRLAIMVEDHPLDYLLFEGTIPKGNYGAGTVMVWDTGTYQVPGVLDRRKSEQLVSEGLRKGRLSIVLHGKKLTGEFALVRTKEKSWLMFKKEPGSPMERPASEDRSVISNRTMAEITHGAAGSQMPEFDLKDAPKASMPRNIKPMLATPAGKPFDHPDWLFELKWDGYRAIAEIEKEQVRLYSRNNLSFDSRFAPLIDSLQHLGHDAVLDGEVVVLDNHGKPSFQLLQQYEKARTGVLVYQVFDLLYLDGHDLRRLPLVRRKEILAQLLHDLPSVKCSEHIQEHGVAFFRAVSDDRLEGMVAKDASSRYREGLRSQSWLKIKTQLRQEAVIGGFTDPKGSRTGLGSLVLGVYEQGELIYLGNAGSGFTTENLAELRSQLDGLVQKACPFKNRPKLTSPVHWVQPRLVCEISFAAWTNDGHMRHPVFLGLREDKNASEVHREQGGEPDAAPRGKPVTAVQPEARTARQPAQPGEEVIGGHHVHLTNMSKVYWPEDGYTKGDLIQYYREVSAFILPYLKDRPQSLHRHPNGIHGSNFFQKDVRQQPPPDWVQTVDLPSESDHKLMRSILCQDEATLVYLANLGCIELNPWNSRVATLDQADYLVLDLDPEDIPFDRVVEAAREVHRVLQLVGADSYCKTSGKRGLHIHVPFGAQYSHDQARNLAELIARIINARLPGTTSLVRRPSGRQGRVYLDYLQNGKGKTLAAPYSVRPYPGATVSTPLKWIEVRSGLDPSRFTIQTMARRLDAVGDLWRPVLGPAIDLPACLDNLAILLHRQSL